MTVYVDDAYISFTHNFHTMRMCHMAADTEEELHAMARALKLEPEWFQPKPPHSIPHYDVSKTKRFQAIARGAEPISQIELVKKFGLLKQKEEHGTNKVLEL